eukprot:TRINITY_DN7088_c0_g1_i4.p1 TRINITY_DN7088_c0_g1~~TRINITY_DN7088_c0_g1_i4.p1  ORF type:complete len:861 (-),score=62.83 TRINITY_DN7088_c0_g1_i4:571-3153(-)
MSSAQRLGSKLKIKLGNNSNKQGVSQDSGSQGTSYLKRSSALSNKRTLQNDQSHSQKEYGTPAFKKVATEQAWQQKVLGMSCPPPLCMVNGLGGQSNQEQAANEIQDYTNLVLKEDHVNRPLWVCPDGRIFLETFSPVYKQAYDFLIAIAEPACRPECIHEYRLTPHSLYAAVSVGLTTAQMVQVLERLSKVQLDSGIKNFIKQSTENYGKVKLVLQDNKFLVESPYPEILHTLLKDDIIKRAVVGDPRKGFTKHKALTDQVGADLSAMKDMNLETGETGQDAANSSIGAIGEINPTQQEVHAFEVQGSLVEDIKRRCMPDQLNYPMLEEYDFRKDKTNPDLSMELKPIVKHRPYQEKSLSKMFGNGRARSGIIVLPCGAGKSLVGVSATTRVKKSCLVLVTSSVSVDQWRHQYKMWSTIPDDQINRFTSDAKERFTTDRGVCITTYTMIAYSGRRSAEAQKVFEEICGREWGMLLMDEVHVVPANMFRRVIGIVKAHCKLGLTATLLREDSKIDDLNFLIGPKLYEANWLDLTREGHIANVSCAEVWCPMVPEFFREYLKKENSLKKSALYVMNPNKFQACEFLINFHERTRGDKIIVFSDNIFALREYATKMQKPFIYGPTSHAERIRILHAFKHRPDVGTVFLSKVGDTSIDIPEANVLIQISCHAGSRRQEAQRLGRILRAKKAKGVSNIFNAFFYTLVSKDTQEMYFSTKRQQFLIDQGYSFKVIPNLIDDATAEEMNLKYRDKKEQLDLLAKVLSASDHEAGEEQLDIQDDISGPSKSSRTVGNMAALAGGEGMFHMEYKVGDKGKNSGGRSRGGQKPNEHRPVSAQSNAKNKVIPSKLDKFKKKMQRDRPKLD